MRNQNDNYRYGLERYRTQASRHTCPQCGRKRCFTYYVDRLTGEPIDPSCGRCDHEHSCGYHLRPREFFGERNGGCGSITPIPPTAPPLTLHLPSTLPAQCMGTETLLHTWLADCFGRETMERVARLYWLGQWSDHRTVYWQIDRRGRVRDGKIMDYLPNGHRNTERPPSWVFSELRRQGRYPAEAVTRKCLFGEHLLARTEGTVGLVESEKSAIYLACRFPQFTWVATGGCKALNAEVLTPLKGRRTVVYPDSGVHDEWAAVLSRVNGLEYCLHNFDYLPVNTDLVDVLTAQ